MRKLSVILVVAMVLMAFAGCEKGTANSTAKVKARSQGTMIVETREYTNDGKKVNYGIKAAGKYDVREGEKLFSSSKYHISANIASVGSGSIRIKFTDKIFYPAENKISDVFEIKKNRTYVFELGSGLEGLEVKFRYN